MDEINGSAENVPLSTQVYDFYGLMGVDPTIDSSKIKKAFDDLVESFAELKPNSAIEAANVGLFILSDPKLRAQYDRERLAYIYRQGLVKDQYLLACNSPEVLDEVHKYSSELVDRVNQPLQGETDALIKEIAKLRKDQKGFERDTILQRQNWPTSENSVVRAAGDVLCKMLVSTRDRIRDLEDELAKITDMSKTAARLKENSSNSSSSSSAGLSTFRSLALVQKQTPKRSPTSSQWASESEIDLATYQRSMRHPTASRHVSHSMRAGLSRIRVSEETVAYPFESHPFGMDRFDVQGRYGSPNTGPASSSGDDTYASSVQPASSSGVSTPARSSEQKRHVSSPVVSKSATVREAVAARSPRDISTTGYVDTKPGDFW
ncbi:hypothetical protein NKR23_g11335 [Pleurostoma richardsiae]|uniref:J domain-containing protein n=1 Tax=Pleurostoma richardsiae TaxID=41990 RepID=A0AA38RAU9_9PEZI|nr:hypothetical protein NKR23_g11335 [Pleurostoma richardsiae]